MAGARAHVRLQAVVLAIGVGLMAVKFIAWRVTGSNAILSDALESIVNVVAGGFALYSLVLAAKPKDREHPYGHGKVEFISAMLEGSMVALAGLVIIYRAVMAWIQGNEVSNISEGMLLIGTTGLVNFGMGMLLRSRGRRTHSFIMEASGLHLLSDAWTTAALLLGLGAIWITGIHGLDSLFAVGFAVYIIWQGANMVRRSVGGIMDETDMAVAGDLVRIIEEHRKEAWIDMHNFRVIKYGSTLHIDAHVTLPWYFTLEAGHHEISELADLVRDSSGRQVEFFIHMDPCVPPASCTICQIFDCPVRQAPFQRKIPWTLDRVLKDLKHSAEG